MTKGEARAVLALTDKIAMVYLAMEVAKLGSVQALKEIQRIIREATIEARKVVTP